ncbi:MAG: acyl-CoA dehydrogenase family protein [Spirochaetia bacterium]
MNTDILYDLYTGRRNDIEESIVLTEPSDRAADLAAKYRALQQEYPPGSLETESRVPGELLDKMRGLGLFGLTVPEEYGGLGFSLTDYLYTVSVMAETDMSLAIIPLAHLSIGIKGILLFGSEEQKKKYLPSAADGSTIYAYALTEPKIGSDARHIETEAVPSDDGSHYTLNGTKTYITNGGYAGGLTVFAQIPRNDDRAPEMGAFVVNTSAKGVTVGDDMPKMGLHVSSTTMIRFKDVDVPKENLLGSPGEGFKIAMTILNYGRLGLGAASAGAIRRSVTDMIDRAVSRKQFGRPIGEYELIREMIGRARIKERQIWGITAYTAGLLEKDPLGNVASESSHTKLYGTEEAWNVLYDALQTAGGSGYLATQPFEKRMRDFRVTTVFEGTSEIHSIYPPLMVMRELSKELEGRAKILQFLALKRMALRSARVKLPRNQNLDRRTASKVGREMSASVKMIRKKIAYGMIRYGKRVSEREFFLRRITRLSLSVYLLISLLILHRDTEEVESRKLTEEAMRYTMSRSARYRKLLADEILKEHSTLRAADAVLEKAI